MKSQRDPDVRAGRFTARFAYHDTPEVMERLERVAIESACSSAAIVRMAVRQFLAEVVKAEPSVIDELLDKRRT